MDKEEILDSIEYLNEIIKEFKEAQKLLEETLKEFDNFLANCTSCAYDS